MHWKSKLRGACATAILATLGTAAAADLPDCDITIVVPTGAGGGTDMHARGLAQFLGPVIDRDVVVVNRTGGGGFIGAAFAAQSRADGCTLMLHSFGTFVLRTMQADQPVDPIEDFDHLGMIGEQIAGVIVRTGDDRFSTIEEFVAFAQENPGLTMAFSGAGGWHHTAGLALFENIGADFTPVPFDGGGAVRRALLGGQVDFAMMGMQQLAGFEEEIMALAVSDDERYPLSPDVPTLNEMGYEAAKVSSPMVVAIPDGAPQDVLDALEAGIAEVAASDGFQSYLEGNNAITRYLTAEDATAYLQSRQVAWQGAVDAFLSAQSQ